MNKLSLFAVISFTSLFFASCDKTDEVPPTNTDYITKAAWKFDKAMTSGVDVSAAISACYKDNIITFQSNGNGVLDEGATKCNGADPQTVNFTWNFSNNGSTLNATGGIFAGQSGAFTVITLNDTQMIIQGTLSGVTGQVYFKH